MKILSILNHHQGQYNYAKYMLYNILMQNFFLKIFQNKYFLFPLQRQKTFRWHEDVSRRTSGVFYAHTLSSNNNNRTEWGTGQQPQRSSPECTLTARSAVFYVKTFRYEPQNNQMETIRLASLCQP